MNSLTITSPASDWHRMKSLVPDAVTSPITKRVYGAALDEFIAWYTLEPRPGFTKATVNAWRVSLEVCGLGSSSMINRLAAIRKLAIEAADNGLLAPERAAGIARVKGVKSVGIRVGTWITLSQAQTLLGLPDIATLKGLRGRAILAVPLGCGLLRSEVATLTFAHVQQRDGRWVIVDLLGKSVRVRTVPMPTWVKVAVDAWTSATVLTSGRVFRPVNRGDRVVGNDITAKVLWVLLRRYAADAGFPGIASHDCRRSCAKFCRAAGGELEQIQLLLGHASMQTTERYLGTRQGLVDAPNDAIKLKVVV